MNEEKKLQVTLNSIDLGQLLDGLRSREESWRQTAEYFRNGEAFSGDDFFIVEECDGEDEAERIADHFRSIIKQVEDQIDEQGGW